MPARSVLLAPLVCDGDLVGAIQVGSKLGGVFTDRELDLAAVLAQQLSAVLSGARLIERLTEAEARLTASGLITTGVDETVCCYAEKTETWVDGPDGTRWEWYVKEADAEELELRRLTGVLAELSSGKGAGLYLRQLPVAGIDSKWIGTNRARVTEGGTLRTAVGELAIEAVDAIRQVDLRAEDARLCGARQPGYRNGGPPAARGRSDSRPPTLCRGAPHRRLRRPVDPHLH